MHIHPTNILIIKRLAHAQACKLHQIHQKPAAAGRANLHILSHLTIPKPEHVILVVPPREVSVRSRWKSEDVFYYNVNVCVCTSVGVDDSVARALARR